MRDCCRVTETKNIAVYGTLMDQFPDNIWNSMPNVSYVLPFFTVRYHWKSVYSLVRSGLITMSYGTGKSLSLMTL